MKDTNIYVSVKSLVIFLCIVAVIYLLFLIHQVILLIFLSLILSLALEPFVKKLDKKKFPHVVSVLIIVGVVVIATIFLFSYAFVPFISQIQVLLQKLPILIENLINMLNMEVYIDDINRSLFEQIIPQAGQLISATVGIFKSLVTIISIIVFVIYILIDLDNLREIFISFFHKNKQNGIEILLNGIETKMGSWFRGQITLMFVIGLFTFVGLTLLGIDYALALAVLAGLLEIIPIIGPAIALIPAAAIGFNEQPVLGLGVIALYLLIQQIENMYLVPKVMNKVLGFNALYTIIALMIGGKLFGFLGVILAIPFSIVMFEIIQYVYKVDLSHLTKRTHQFTKSPDTAGK